MKIRIEKLEIDQPEEMVDAVFESLAGVKARLDQRRMEMVEKLAEVFGPVLDHLFKGVVEPSATSDSED